MAELQLSGYDESLLNGDRGDGARLSMEILVRYAQALGAQQLIPVTSAHVDSCLYIGESSLAFARLLTLAGASVSVPTTLNVGAVDLLHPHLNRGDPARIRGGQAP